MQVRTHYFLYIFTMMLSLLVCIAPIATAVELPQVIKNWTINVQGKEVSTSLRSYMRNNDPDQQTVMVPLTFLIDAFQLRQKKTTLSNAKQTFQFNSDYSWMKYSDSELVRTVPMTPVEVDGVVYLPLRKVVNAMGMLIKTSGRNISILKSTPTPKPTAVPATPTPVATTKSSDSGTSATVSPATSSTCDTELTALKLQNQQLKSQVQQLQAQIQLLQSSSMSSSILGGF